MRAQQWQTTNHQFQLSIPAYLIGVALVTTLGIALAMWLRPAFAYSIQLSLGLIEQPQATPDSFYTERITPLFNEHCASCHGEQRQKGDLRLDSFSVLVRGGKHGPIIAKGDDENSELIARLTLPPENDKVMPPAGKPPMREEDITVIKLWIAAGASGNLPVTAIPDAPSPEIKTEIPTIDATAVAEARAPLTQSVKQLQERFPGILFYESRGSANLRLNASLLKQGFGDKELKAFASVCERIVWADFSRTSITDGSAEVIAECKNIQTLRLAYTKITDPIVQYLKPLKALKSLTVLGTELTESSLAPLRNQGVKIYDGSKTSSGTNETS